MISELNTSQYESFYQGSTEHAVILLPGLCGSELELGSIPKLLRQSNHTYLIPRIPGYSAHSGLTQYSEWIDIVDSLVIQLLESHLSVSIAGISMGATLALAVAEQNEQLQSLVLLSPVLTFDGWSVPWYRPLLLLIYRLGFRNWHYMEKSPYGVKNIEMRRRIEKLVKANKVSELGAAHLPARNLYESAKLATHVKGILDRICSNLLIIHSIDDETASPRNADLIHEKTRSETKKIIWLGNCYHIITVDNEKEIVANETITFINLMYEQALSLERNKLKNTDLVIKFRDGK
jgi:carboxylesterase